MIGDSTGGGWSFLPFWILDFGWIRLCSPQVLDCAVFISLAAIRIRKCHAAKRSENIRRTEEINTLGFLCLCTICTKGTICTRRDQKQFCVLGFECWVLGFKPEGQSISG